MEQTPPTEPGAPAAIPTGVPVAGSSTPPPSQTSTRSIVALVLGILSITCCGFFAGIPAIFLGRAELQGINEGKISESNRTVAKVGMILGIIGAILSFLIVCFYIVLIVLGISTGMMQGL